MVVFNSYGIVGFVGTFALVWVLDGLIRPALHLPQDAGGIYELQAACLLLGLYGLTLDRCEEPTLLQGYVLNIKNFFMEMSRQPDNGKGVLWRPVRRLCVCVLPLALAPLFMQAGLIIFRLLWTLANEIAFQSRDFTLECVAGFAMIALWYAYSVPTHRLRDLPEVEIVLPMDKA